MVSQGNLSAVESISISIADGRVQRRNTTRMMAIITLTLNSFLSSCLSFDLINSSSWSTEGDFSLLLIFS